MDLHKELNIKQCAAAESTSQYLRIIAGAGTGKTRTLTYRLAHQILMGADPKRMLAITFTNKAAREMRTRVEDLLKKEGFEHYGLPLVCTFHGFCCRFLRKEIQHVQGYSTSFQIAGDEETNTIYKTIFSTMEKGSDKVYCQSIVDKISRLKTEGKFPSEVAQGDIPLDALYNYDELIHVYKEYQRMLMLQNLLDFDDLLMLTVFIMETNEDIRDYWKSKYDYFLVDEFQDTNNLQYYLIQLFMSKTAYLTVVGDPDQTIYTWRGAQNKIIKENLEKDYSSLETVILDENYRSTQSILNTANMLIDHNRNRTKKDLIAANGVVGKEVEYHDYDSAEKEAYQVALKIRTLYQKNVGYDKIAVIYRSNYLSNAIEHQLTNFKIPYEIYGGMKFFERAEIKDAISYLRLAVNPDDFSFSRILKAPTKGIGDVAWNKALNLKKELGEEVSMLAIFRNYQDQLGLNKKSKAALSTFYHAFDCFAEEKANAVEGAQMETAIMNYFMSSGFMDYINREDEKAKEKMSYMMSSSTSKADNVAELLRSINVFFGQDVLDEDGTSRTPTLEDFLIDVALQSDQDTMTDAPKVSLMTGHVSKGLEFPYVFIIGLNQMIFPTFHAIQSRSSEAIEEERRLMYVCMTRAMKELYLSSFRGMNFRNGMQYTPSMFIQECNVKISQKEPQKQAVKKNPFLDYDPYVGSHRPSWNMSQTNSVKEDLNKKVAQLGVRKSISEEVYEIGDKIVHTSFGIGVVKALLGDKIVVEFPSPYGEKKLMKGFKAFRKVKED